MAIKKIHLPDGTEVVIDEWLHYAVFSTIEWASTVQVNLKAFTYVQGQSVPQTGLAPRNATESDTNQVAKTRMNHDEAFLCYAMTYEAFGLTNAIAGNNNVLAEAPMMLSQNLRRLQRDVVVSLVVGANIRKPQARSPFSWLGQSIGAAASMSGDAVQAGSNLSYGTGGQITATNQRRYNLPVYIAADRVFYVEVRSFPGVIEGLTQDCQLRMYIDGLKRRPVA